MSCLGNVIWILFGGLAIALEYMISGLIMCCTIIGIPFGVQAFKMGLFALMPFGQEVVVDHASTGCLSAVMNIIWFFIGGVWIALTHLLLGVLFCITIIGFPFGIQHFKLMALALSPFGRSVQPIP
ncbi:MAG: YccF domain-containing protein [Bacteroidales bacterium]